MAELRAIFTVLVILACVSKKPATVAGDINCENCKNRAAELHQQVKMKLAEIKHKKNLAPKLFPQVEKQPESEGQCNREHRETIERTCREFPDLCYTDVVEYLYNFDPDINSLKNYVCKVAACPRTVSKLAQDFSAVSNLLTRFTKAASKMGSFTPFQ